MVDRSEQNHPGHAVSTPIPGVLDPSERTAVEATFGVDSEQVARDHVISHVLAAISSVNTDNVVFFGGTALSRTHLADLRLSEDIDLIARGDRITVADQIETAIVRRLRRTFGTVSFTPRLREARHPAPSVLRVGDVRVQIQLLASSGYPSLPTEVRTIEQRYSDSPPARLRVLTGAAFVASKLSAWHDRQTSRDLYDLWALTEAGLVDSAALALFTQSGALTDASKVSFTYVPSAAEWRASLSHQCRPRVSPEEAAKVVRRALGST